MSDNLSLSGSYRLIQASPHNAESSQVEMIHHLRVIERTQLRNEFKFDRAEAENQERKALGLISSGGGFVMTLSVFLLKF